MTDKELIKQEIERRIAEGALALESLLDFIDNLQKESGCEADCTTIDEDLEAEIQRYFSEEKWIEKPVSEIAVHFADWQHGKDFNDLLSSEMEFPKEFYAKGKADAMNEMKETLQTEYEKGRFDMREEMMKNIVLETKVMMDCDGDGIETPYKEWLTLENTEIPYIPDKLGLKDGDKVKIIIVKEEQ